MNDDMKRLLSRFLCVSVLIGCFVLLFVGTITAKQRSEYNSYRTEYAVLTVKSQNRRVSVEVGENSFNLDLSPMKEIDKYKNLILLTPLSPIFYLCECFSRIFLPSSA